MEKIFYTKQSDYKSTDEVIVKILQEHFQIPAPKILRTESGKPYLAQEHPVLFFSVSHTNGVLFIAFCDENVGIDVEKLDREVNFLPIVKKFHESERKNILSAQDFLRYFTAKESGVKWLGGTLGKDFLSLRLCENTLFYKGTPLPVHVCCREFDGYILTIVAEKDFSFANIYTL